MREYLPQDRCPRASALPQLGIFSVIAGALYVDCTPVLEAEAYGDFHTHPHGHVEGWPRLVTRLEMRSPWSYDYYRRGRVNDATREGHYQLYLDRCLLHKRRLVKGIIQRLHLADQAVAILTDEHDQCAVCNPDDEPDVRSRVGSVCTRCRRPRAPRQPHPERWVEGRVIPS